MYLVIDRKYGKDFPAIQNIIGFQLLIDEIQQVCCNLIKNRSLACFGNRKWQKEDNIFIRTAFFDLIFHYSVQRCPGYIVSRIFFLKRRLEFTNLVIQNFDPFLHLGFVFITTGQHLDLLLPQGQFCIKFGVVFDADKITFTVGLLGNHSICTGEDCAGLIHQRKDKWFIDLFVEQFDEIFIVYEVPNIYSHLTASVRFFRYMIVHSGSFA